MSVVNCVVYDRNSGTKQKDIPLDKASEALAENADYFVWVGLYEPDQVEMALVREEFGLHELAVEDAMRAQQRPKVESYGDTLFLAIRTARLEKDDIAMGHTYIFVAARYVITVRQGASLSYSSVRMRCENNARQMKLGPGFVLYGLLDFVVDNYFPVVEDLDDYLKSIEHDLFTSTFSKRTVQHLYDLKRDLVRLRMAIAPMQDISSFLMHQADVQLVPKVIYPYLRDINDHVLRLTDLINAQGEMLKVAMDVNLAMVSLGQNEVVKRLASWAAILALPTMIASFYGMNFKYMPELDWHYGYPAVLLAMFGGCVVLWRRLRKVGWL